VWVIDNDIINNKMLYAFVLGNNVIIKELIKLI